MPLPGTRPTRPPASVRISPRAELYLCSLECKTHNADASHDERQREPKWSGCEAEVERPGVWGQSFHVRGLWLKINCFEFQFPHTAVKNNLGECVHYWALPEASLPVEHRRAPVLSQHSTPPHLRNRWKWGYDRKTTTVIKKKKVQLKARDCCPLLGNPSEGLC